MKHLLLVLLLGTSFSASSQNDLDTLIGDMLVLSSDFIQPAADGSVYQAAASWYKSGATNALWEVDFAVMNNVLFIPQKRRDFVFQNTDYQNLYLQNGEAAAVLPTAIGGDTNVVIAGTALGESFDFRAFEGLGQDAVYHPYAQAAVGLPKGFELKVRYAPKIEINDSNFQILGLGLQSNLNALFGEHKNEKDLAMPLQVSALVAYANFKVDFLFDPFELPGASINSTIIAANTWLFQVVASKKIKRFDLFYALGFTRSTFEYELGGEKTLFLEALNAALTSLDTVQSDLKFDLGFNYNLNKFTLNNTFSFGKFANYNLGIYYTIN